MPIVQPPSIAVAVHSGFQCLDAKHRAPTRSSKLMILFILIWVCCGSTHEVNQAWTRSKKGYSRTPEATASRLGSGRSVAAGIEAPLSCLFYEILVQFEGIRSASLNK